MLYPFAKDFIFISFPSLFDILYHYYTIYANKKRTCLKDKLEICGTHGDCSNTDLNKVFDLILNTALQNNLKQEDLPKNILIVSDMEFDYMIHNSIYGSTTESFVGIY